MDGILVQVRSEFGVLMRRGDVEGDASVTFSSILAEEDVRQ